MAYAAVTSLKHTIRHLKDLTNPHITESAYDVLNFLEYVLGSLDYTTNTSTDMSLVNALNKEMRDKVCKLEDVLDSYVLHHSLPTPQGFGNNWFLQIPSVDEKGVKQEIDLFFKTMTRLVEEYMVELNKPFPVDEDDSVLAIDENKSTIVGLSDQLQEIIADLLHSESESRTVSLMGMVGIGKTHLAREIYQHPMIVQHFDFIAWVRIGQKLRIKSIFVDILAQLEGKLINVYVEQDMSSLRLLVKQSLQGLRYLLFLDDVWSPDIHSRLLWMLPNNRNGSLLCLTTRLQQVVHDTRIHDICFLNNEESWNLLWLNVLGEKSFSPQLEIAGRKVAENCEGLPLLILQVADIVSGLDKTEEYWKKVANKKTSTFTDAYDKIAEVLYSSYDYLPQHLKPCFLYMGVFPQSSEIPLPKLIHLWTVEDFLEPMSSQTSEDFAVGCLQKLVSNSLAIICKRNFHSAIKSCKLRSAYWHLCVKQVKEDQDFACLEEVSRCFQRLC